MSLQDYRRKRRLDQKGDSQTDSCKVNVFLLLRDFKRGPVTVFSSSQVESGTKRQLAKVKPPPL